MQRYTNNVQDGFGNALSGVTVTVREVSGGAIADIFSDNGVSAKANPFTNDPDGEFFFYAADDRYNIFFTGPAQSALFCWRHSPLRYRTSHQRQAHVCYSSDANKNVLPGDSLRQVRTNALTLQPDAVC